MPLFDVYPLNPIKVSKALGSYVWDHTGQRYLDMYGGHAVISIGHSHPHWVSRIEDQLQKIAFYSNSVILEEQRALADKLGKLSGKPDYQLFLVNSGAEANENALKLASFYNNRNVIVSFRKSFHGRTSLAVAVTDNPAIVAPVNKNDNIHFLPLNDEHALQDFFTKSGDKISSVIIEGIQGVGGIREATPQFLQLIRSLCDQYGALYIADSVQCGYGRTGRFFSHDYAGVNADIYTMAKGMGNGFPVGGCLIAPHIKPKHGMLGTTFGGNPLACAAALAVLEVMEAESLMDNAIFAGEKLMTALQKMSGIKNLRGRGLMIGFDVEEEHAAVRAVLLKHYFTFTGEAKPNVVRLLPSLALSNIEIDLFIENMQQALHQVEANAPTHSAS